MKSSKSMSEALIEQDLMLVGEAYEQYRQGLQSALTRAKRRERMAYGICLVSGVISFSLMFVGGSQVFGSFDPGDKTATPFSIVLGATYVVTLILFWVLLASYYSRFRPNTQRARDFLRDEQIQQLERSIAELKDLIVASHSQESRSSSEPNKINSDSD